MSLQSFATRFEHPHLTERFTRVGPHTLLYEFTVRDPRTFTRPFTATVPMKKLDAPIFEYACHEGNYRMVNLLSGSCALGFFWTLDCERVLAGGVSR